MIGECKESDNRDERRKEWSECWMIGRGNGDLWIRVWVEVIVVDMLDGTEYSKERQEYGERVCM